MSTPDAARQTVLRQRLDAVKARIAAGTAAAGRSVEPELIVVTKFHPAADVVLLAGLGVSDVGENRDQEAAAKAAELNADGVRLRWHFIGQLQSNKAKSVANYASAVHSVDRLSLVPALARAAAAALAEGRRAEPLGCFIQVDLDAEPVGTQRLRGGARPGEVPGIADAIAAETSLELRGVMAVAPLGADPVAAFARLSRVSAELRRSHPGATEISAGMSADLEAAIAHGATHLRVGSDVLGPRPVVR
ncbi:YggS family pyridoxal phosphate-dependent enzyme [Arthrobacter russicus]|uniref:Pyridoxal phosphate homeostasis protein n=1 Tax=Arthrobacter russicus TaxID=172040 RepID=A0ABU1JF98_9MICC|nr:YggS family pyridoxal phosphate-dependent enzyme [Arthrobacter russicus]MDR6271100.1 pyridoxal phosphate enzyme (YggS family) [Arthrobacter russicus]